MAPARYSRRAPVRASRSSRLHGVCMAYAWYMPRGPPACMRPWRVHGVCMACVHGMCAWRVHGVCTARYVQSMLRHAPAQPRGRHGVHLHQLAGAPRNQRGTSTLVALADEVAAAGLNEAVRRVYLSLLVLGEKGEVELVHPRSDRAEGGGELQLQGARVRRRHLARHTLDALQQVRRLGG